MWKAMPAVQLIDKASHPIPVAGELVIGRYGIEYTLQACREGRIIRIVFSTYRGSSFTLFVNFACFHLLG